MECGTFVQYESRGDRTPHPLLFKNTQGNHTANIFTGVVCGNHTAAAYMAEARQMTAQDKNNNGQCRDSPSVNRRPVASRVHAWCSK